MGVIKIRDRRRNRHFYEEEHSGICVVRHDGESDDNLIRRFRKKCSKSGISVELRQRMYFEKPSNKKRRKKAQSIRYKIRFLCHSSPMDCRLFEPSILRMYYSYSLLEDGLIEEARPGLPGRVGAADTDAAS